MTRSDDPVEDLLDAARRARCRDAEVFLKMVTVRQVAIEPPAIGGNAAQRIVSRHSERGTALRVIDAEGREGFAWRGDGEGSGESAVPGQGAGRGVLGALVRDAMESARIGGSAPAGWPPGPDPGKPVEGLVDPEALRRPDEALAALAAAAVAEVARRAEGSLEVDRVVVSEAATSIRLARLSGAAIAWERTLAAITVAVAPAVSEADAAVEERSACRLGDLDPIAAARAAVARALPRRPASIPEAIAGLAPAPGSRSAAESAMGPGSAADPAPPVAGGAAPAVAVPASLILAPRAAASLWAALAPLFEARAITSSRASALDVADDPRVPGRPSSAPCDGNGRPAGRRLLMQAGAPIERPEAAPGWFVRASYRDLPAPGIAALLVEPGRSIRPPGDSIGLFALQVEALEVHQGSPSWSIEIRRGDWRRLDGDESMGGADGITWEGPPAAIVQAVVATLDDLSWFEVGLPVATPSVVLEGLGPWRLPEPED